ncbi:MAG: hypothetical protein ACYS8K_09300 [Planctomycetota bacterium]
MSVECQPDGAAGPSRHHHAAIARVALAAAAAGVLGTLCWRFLAEPGRTGAWFDDWDYFFHVYEAVRISILRHGQFPWWNIWSCGGVPLFANPQAGVISLNTAFVLLFGTVLGLKLSVVAHVLFGFEGMRRLLRRHVSGEFALFGAAAFVGCGGLAMHLAIGHFSACAIYFLPWLLLLALRLPEGSRYGWFFGGLMAVMALESIHYMTVLAGLIAAVAAVCVLLRSRGQRRQVAAGIAVAFALFLMVAGFRLGLTLHYVRQYSLTAGEPVATLGREVGAALLSPRADLLYGRLDRWHGWWEYGCYVGPVVAALFCFSLVRGVRYWHVGAAACLAAAVSATAIWSPSLWLGKVPLLGSMRVLTRWRLPAAFFIAMGAAAEADALWKRARRGWLRLVVAGICLAALADMFGLSYRVARQAFPGPPAPARHTAALPPFRHTPPARGEPVQFRRLFDATRNNQGVVAGYEPVMGYDRSRPTALLSRGDPDYAGEAVAGGMVISPAYWSPNRIVYEDVPGPLRLNLAPGSYWRVNGRDPFAEMHVSEPSRPFVVEPDAAGRIELRIVPSGWPGGAFLTLAGVVLLAAVTLPQGFARSQGRAPRAPEEAAENSPGTRTVTETNVRS